MEGEGLVGAVHTQKVRMQTVGKQEPQVKKGSKVNMKCKCLFWGNREPLRVVGDSDTVTHV